jgi:prophage maintenance system killer protein
MEKDTKDNNQVVVFIEDGLELNINFDYENETVWLTQAQLSELFESSSDNISLHLKNIYGEGELSESLTTEDFSVVRIEGSREVKRTIKHYNLDAVLSVGYRVKSIKATQFRKWANTILSSYLKKGYVINSSKVKIPNLTEITEILDNYRKFDGDLHLSGNELLEFMIAYNRSLSLLDDYDHQSFELPNGSKDVYRIEYKECLDIVKRSKFTGKNDNFGKERDKSFDSSISTIYQTYDGKELYPTLEQKAAMLLYLVTKNHSFIDGNKRIASTVFLYFLDRNKSLFVDGRKRISDETLATLTILIAASNPKDKDIIINLILAILN